jgi:hypothetical protein
MLAHGPNRVKLDRNLSSRCLFPLRYPPRCFILMHFFIANPAFSRDAPHGLALAEWGLERSARPECKASIEAKQFNKARSLGFDKPLSTHRAVVGLAFPPIVAILGRASSG